MTATRGSAGSPVSDRLLVLQFMRLLNLVALFVVPVLAGVESRRAVAVGLVYLVVVAGIELLRRRCPPDSRGSTVCRCSVRWAASPTAWATDRKRRAS